MQLNKKKWVAFRRSNLRYGEEDDYRPTMGCCTSSQSLINNNIKCSLSDIPQTGVRDAAFDLSKYEEVNRRYVAV